MRPAVSCLSTAVSDTYVYDKKGERLFIWFSAFIPGNLGFEKLMGDRTVWIGGQSGHIWSVRSVALDQGSSGDCRKLAHGSWLQTPNTPGWPGSGCQPGRFRLTLCLI